jgi:hypothetical protein
MRPIIGFSLFMSPESIELPLLSDKMNEISKPPDPEVNVLPLKLENELLTV